MHASPPSPALPAAPDAHINYHNRLFRAVQNTESGEVDAETRFHYRQTGQIIWATYHGGAIQMGTLIGTADAAGQLQFTYQHLNRTGNLMAGRCTSTPERLPDGRLRLHEVWQWTTGDHTSGTSIIEEIAARPGVTRLSSRFAICRLGPTDPLPAWATGSELLALTRTPQELSIVCAHQHLPDDLPPTLPTSRDWACFQVEGPLNLNQTGILAALATRLAHASIPIFAVSTYDTDYILVPHSQAEIACALLNDPLPA